MQPLQVSNVHSALLHEPGLMSCSSLGTSEVQEAFNVKIIRGQDELK